MISQDEMEFAMYVVAIRHFDREFERNWPAASITDDEIDRDFEWSFANQIAEDQFEKHHLN